MDEMYDCFPLRATSTIKPLCFSSGRSDLEDLVARGKIHYCVANLYNNRISWTMGNSFDAKLLANFLYTVERAQQHVRVPRNVGWEKVQSRLSLSLRPKSNTDVRTAFLHKNAYNVKKFFTFGLRTVAHDTCHVYQTSNAAVLFYHLAENRTRNRPLLRERVFRAIDQFDYEMHVMEPHKVYLVQPATRYLILTVQPSTFTLDIVTKERARRLSSHIKFMDPMAENRESHLEPLPAPTPDDLELLHAPTTPDDLELLHTPTTPDDLELLPAPSHHDLEPLPPPTPNDMEQLPPPTHVFMEETSKVSSMPVVWYETFVPPSPHRASFYSIPEQHLFAQTICNGSSPPPPPAHASVIERLYIPDMELMEDPTPVDLSKTTSSTVYNPLELMDMDVGESIFHHDGQLDFSMLFVDEGGELSWTMEDVLFDP